MLVTSLAMLLEFGMRLKRSRSNASPRSGETTTTAMMKASHAERCALWISAVNNSAAT